MHKGDLDAAIDRFQDAIRLRSNFAKPRLLLAEAYEKKGDKATAVKYYKEYLKVLPDAPDRKKVRQKIHASSVGRWRNYEKVVGPLHPSSYRHQPLRAPSSSKDFANFPWS